VLFEIEQLGGVDVGELPVAEVGQHAEAERALVLADDGSPASLRRCASPSPLRRLKRVEHTKRACFQALFEWSVPGIEPATSSLQSARSTAPLSRFRTTKPKTFRSNPLESAPPGVLLARNWRAAHLIAGCDGWRHVASSNVTGGTVILVLATQFSCVD
jgi:hypothetical protein